MGSTPQKFWWQQGGDGAAPDTAARRDVDVRRSAGSAQQQQQHPLRDSTATQRLDQHRASTSELSCSCC